MLFNRVQNMQMGVKKPPGKFILFLLAFFIVPISVFGDKYSWIPPVFQSNDFEVVADATVEIRNVKAPVLNILEKLHEKDDELAGAKLSIGPKEIIYYENRYNILLNKSRYECDKAQNSIWDETQSVCKSVNNKRFSDKERTIGLKLLNTKTGEINIISVKTKITIDGVHIEAPDGYKIDIVERPNGIRWNLWNTLYRVSFPDNMVVIKNNYPREEAELVSRVVKGKVIKERKKTAKSFLYVPYSEFFEKEETNKILIDAGRSHVKAVVQEAFDILRERKVKSRSFPDNFVVDSGAMPSSFFEHLPLLEQGDFTEFQLDPQKTAEKVLITLGSNGRNAWQYTCNRSDACGWVQFTPGTYANIRKTYPLAKLNPDFKEGAGDQLNSIMAAILLYDYNLDNLVRRYGIKILNDPRLEEYLAASYNGAPKWVYNSLTATINKNLPDWTGALSPTRKDSFGGLRKETRDFMVKLRYLIENNLP